jgi:UTP-glucose-1-phosphate uridylyltransferase
MTGNGAIQVVVCAGGLGTRIAGWSRYIPKEFFPVGGRPGITHLLDEITRSGPADVVIVCHPYYDAFTAWARTALSPHGHDRYAQAARLQPGPGQAGGLAASFITQEGLYADLTSVLNGADHLAASGDLYVVFADNLYPGESPLLALRRASSGHAAVLGRAYRRELAASHGVIAAIGHHGELLMGELIEKPGLAAVMELERRYGTGRLRLLEGRARLTAQFVSFARSYRAPPGTEPKLALALAAYARHCPVSVITTTSQVIDLGTSPACGCAAARQQQATQ